MSDSPHVIEVTGADFEARVLDESRRRPVIVDFWAEWCAPCRALGPMLEQLAEEYAGKFLLAKVDVEDESNHPLARAFRVEGIPAVRAVRDGQVVLEFVGLLPEASLRQFIERVLPSAAEGLASEAAGLADSDPVAAERKFAESLEQAPGNEAARVGLARLLAARGADAEALDVLEPVGSDGEHGEAARRIIASVHLKRLAADFGDETAARHRLEAEPTPRRRYELGCVLAAVGKHEEALRELLQAGEDDFSLAGGPVREAMTEVFAAAGVTSPLANDYRRKLTSLLF